VLVFDEVEEEWQEPAVRGIARVLEKLAGVGLYEFEYVTFFHSSFSFSSVSRGLTGCDAS
jgi:hypothetical protein